MITRLRVKNFKALRDVEVNLTPIHVLIGPNDSGKTSILDALAALCRSVDHDLVEAFLGSWKGTELVWHGEADFAVSIGVDLDDSFLHRYSFDALFGVRGKRGVVAAETFDASGFQDIVLGPIENKTWVKEHTDNPGSDRFRPDNFASVFNAVSELLNGVHYYRWDPGFLALPVAPDTKRRFRMESNGFGLALCLDEILNFDRDRFIQLEKRFTEIFPHITSIKLIQEMAYRAPVDAPDQVAILQRTDGKGLYFRLSTTEQLVPASQMSDGVLLVLAYLAVLYLPEPPRVLLVEEPENGIHPKRLRVVLGILRELIQEQSRTQVVLTTHSPYALDLFSPEEVTLCTMQDNGEVRTTRLSESPAVRRESGVFTLGEIWTSQGDERIAESQKIAEGDGQ